MASTTTVKSCSHSGHTTAHIKQLLLSPSRGLHISGSTQAVPLTPAESTGEDDGYLITFVHNEQARDSNGSELVIYNARSFSSQALARVAMPQRVPYGFHSTWVPEHEFQQQWQASALPGVFPTNGKHRCR